MTDADRARAWWDAAVLKAVSTNECVDGPWEALGALLRERDAYKAVVDAAREISEKLGDDYVFERLVLALDALEKEE